MQLIKNNWSTNLAAPAPAAALEFTVPAGAVTALGAIAPGDFYVATLARVLAGVEVAWEVVHITAATGAALSVTRAQEGTSALDWQVGESISLRVTAGLIEDLRGGSEPPAPAPTGRFGAPRPAVGRYLSAQISSGLVLGSQFFQPSVRLVPFEVPVAMSIDQLLCHATTAGAGREVRLAVYGSDANGWPSARLRQTDALSAAVAGPITGSISPLELEPGRLYWLALQTSASFFVICMNQGVALTQPTATDSAGQSISRLLSFAAGLPSDWVHNPAEITSLPAPYVLARRSA